MSNKNSKNLNFIALNVFGKYDLVIIIIGDRK